MEQKKPPDKPVHYMKCKKTSLKSIAKSDNTIEILTSKVNLVHKIAVHTLHFIKLYTIDFYNKNQKFQTIDEQFILEVMKVICVQSTGAGAPSNQDTLNFRKPLQQFIMTITKNFKELNNLTENIFYKFFNILPLKLSQATKTTHDNISLITLNDILMLFGRKPS